ncbi:MAG: glycosyltransferase [Anaerolineae bacterium]|nr:glycosyltransferase [Anaerolineae bacterium]
MRILYITPYVPSLIRVRPYNLIRSLAQHGHQITLLSLSSSAQEEKDADQLTEWCQRVETISVSRMRSLWNCVKALPQPWFPLQAVYSFSPRMQKRIQTLLKEEPFDLVHVEHLRGAHFGTAVAGVPKVYDSVDCISLLFEKALHSAPSLASRLIAWLDLGRTRRYEGRLVSQYDKVLVTSPQDKEALLKLDGRSHEQNQEKKIAVLSNGVDLGYFAFANGYRAPETLVFSGKMSYHANVAAVSYMVREVMPLVWARRPGVKLEIVGKNPPQAICALAKDDRVHVTGFVPDLRPYLSRATVSVSPMQYSVGIQNKVLEAMAMGTPVVASSQACSALKVRNGTHLLVADEPTTFAERVLGLLDDVALRREMAINGRNYVEERHDWRTIAHNLENIYAEVMERWRSLS